MAPRDSSYVLGRFTGERWWLASKRYSGFFPAASQSARNQASAVPAAGGKNTCSSRRSWMFSAQDAWERVWNQNARSSAPPSTSAQSPGAPETPDAKLASSHFGNGSTAARRRARCVRERTGRARVLSASGSP